MAASLNTSRLGFCWAFILQAFGIIQKIVIKIEFVFKPFFIHLAIGKINIEKNEIPEIHFEDPAFIDHTLRMEARPAFVRASAM